MIRNFVDFLFLYGHFVSLTLHKHVADRNRQARISTKTRISMTRTIRQSPKKGAECLGLPVAVETQPRERPCLGLEARRGVRPGRAKALQA